MKARTHGLVVTLCLLVWAALAGVSVAQDSELTLYVRRNFGYGGGSQIQGNFRCEIEGPEGLTSVTYYVDDQVLATTTEAPFTVNFETDSYPHGVHELKATATTADGRTLTSNTRKFEFVAAEVGWQVAGQMGGTILLVAFGAMVVIFGIQTWVVGRDRKAGGKGYGLMGAAICPKCGKPFGIHIWGLNALGGKFDRCDHCGKWSMVRRASPAALAAAEAADAPTASIPAAEATKERERRQLDDTRYSDDV